MKRSDPAGLYNLLFECFSVSSLIGGRKFEDNNFVQWPRTIPPANQEQASTHARYCMAVKPLWLFPAKRWKEPFHGVCVEAQQVEGTLCYPLCAVLFPLSLVLCGRVGIAGRCFFASEVII